MPKKRSVKFTDLDQVVADIQHLHAVGYDRAGELDLGQICSHIRQFMVMSMTKFPFTLSSVEMKVGKMKIKLPFFPRLMQPVMRFVTLSTRFIPAGIVAPSAIAATFGEPGRDAEEIQALAETIETLKTYDGLFAPSPVAGILSPAQWLDFHLIHAQTHLSFMLPTVAVAQTVARAS